MRATANTLAAVLAASILVSVAHANPVVLWYLRDSPVEAPNGVWDDQWSGGTVLPEGEVILPQDPGYDPDCWEFEELNSFVRLGAGENALRAYLDPPVTGTQVGGAATGTFSFRQTTPEAATVCVELYRVDADGGSPEFIGDDCLPVENLASWPPTPHFFTMGTVPLMEMQNERFMVLIHCDGQYTDLVWDCIGWDGWIQLPQDDPFNPVEAMRWSSIKAMYR